MERLVKVYFRLEPDVDGYPPVSVESVWARSSGADGEYVLDNVPFFEKAATLGDTIHAQETDGVLWFDRLVSRSQNSLLRAVFFQPHGEAESEICRQLESLGCQVERWKNHHLLAISVPAQISLTMIQEYLHRQSEAGTLDYEEPILRQ